MWVRFAAIAIVAALAFWLLHNRIDPAAIHDYAARLNGFAVFGLLVALPMVGFPASVLHVAAGIRFGMWLGLLLVAISIGLQLLASYGLVHLFHDRFAHRFDRWRRRIPRGAHASICIFAVLLPGAPYAVVNYVLPMVGVRLRTYLLCCWPLHVLRSTVTVLLGDQTDKLTPTRVMVIGAYALVLAVVSGWLYRRLRRQLVDQPSAEGGRMQPA
jgi:uncharacterized membrane protein YdjX (TVP38/TMEM64 family)